MQAEISQFVFPATSQEIRIVDVNGEPWWIAKDVCEILAIANSRDAMNRLDQDEKDVVNADTLGGSQNLSIINEAGLYSLILTSRKPEAKEFKRWVTHEVLPSIRKTGGYGGRSTIAEMLDDPAQANTLMLELLTRNTSLKEENQHLKQQVALQTPKVEALSRIESSDGSLCIRDTAKTLGIREKTLFSHMMLKKWIYKRPGTSSWLAFADKLTLGLMEHATTVLPLPDGTEKVRTQARVTGKGLAKLSGELCAISQNQN